MQSPHQFRRVAALLFLPLATGCALTAALTGRFEEPEVQVRESKVQSLSLTTARIAVGLIVSNPNAYALHVSQLAYLVRIGGIVVAQGRVAEAFDLPANASAPVELPIEVHLEALAVSAAAALMVGEVPYELHGTLSVGALMLQREIDYSESSVLRFNLPLGLARTIKRIFATPAAPQLG